jgi:protein O-mannosyl-transferase
MNETPEQPLAPPPTATTLATGPKTGRVRRWVKNIGVQIRSYFAEEPLTFISALVPLCFLSIALYTRHWRTNFIFDEQEALLANPFVRSVTDHQSHLHWQDAFRRDFWGLPHDRTIGSYRPLPDIVWRFFWMLGAREQSPFLHHWVNVLLHGANGALVAVLAHKLTKDRVYGWFAGVTFTATAVVTEAVSGVVGLADVLGALGSLLALLALWLPLWGMPFAVCAATLVGLYSKESALCTVPLVPFACLLLAQITHPKRPMRYLRALLCAIATTAAFVFYVEQRRRMFPAVLPSDLTVEANLGKPWATRFYHSLLRWYAQPILPKDPLNNPLVDATTPQRIAAGLRVYVRGLGEVLFPYRLSGDYSSPQEPIPGRLVFPESIVGGLALIGPIVAAPILGAYGVVRKRPFLSIAAVAMMWVVVSYFPVSNIPILLPTVRAERFWYFPAIGTSLLLAMGFAYLVRRPPSDNAQTAAIAAGLGLVVLGAAASLVPSLREHRAFFVGIALSGLAIATAGASHRLYPSHVPRVGLCIVAAFFVWQAIAARAHANDYTDDLVFWDATRKAVPHSAKAHLNYSVMQGARGNLEERRKSNSVALELAPKWPMASIYLGDTLCRMHRAEEAWPHYKVGFELNPADPNLIALGLQCLWDEKYYSTVAGELQDMGELHPGSWLDFLQRDMADHGEEHNGVDPKYRPRGYNEGPKNDN